MRPQLLEHAAQFVRLARVAVDRRDQQITADQRDRRAAAGGAIAADRPHQPLSCAAVRAGLRCRRCAPHREPDPAAAHDRAGEADQDPADADWR